MIEIRTIKIGSYHLLMPSDLNSKGKPKYYRSQHLLSNKPSKGRRHLGYQKSLAMHDRNIAKCNKRASSKAARRAKRQERNRQRRLAVSDRVRSL